VGPQTSPVFALNSADINNIGDIQFSNDNVDEAAGVADEEGGKQVVDGGATRGRFEHQAIVGQAERATSWVNTIQLITIDSSLAARRRLLTGFCGYIYCLPRH